MNLREQSSRYGAAVLFSAGIAGAMLLAAAIKADFKPDLEIWLACALVVSLILHARAGFALSQAQREIDMLRRLLEKFENKRKDKAPSISVKFDTEALNECDREILEQVRASMEQDRVDLYLQPIVSLPQRKFRFFEAFSRLRREDGSVLKPADYLDAAERANRIGVIDNLILLRAVQALRQLGREGEHYRIFCNVSPATIFDSDFFARFTDYLDTNEDLAHKLVFEFTSPAVEIMNDRVERNLELIAKRGYAFSIDHIRRFDLDWRRLREKNFRYVKASSALLLKELAGGAEGRNRVHNFRKRLRDQEIDLIVEKVEMESHVPEILALGIDYGQGQLFGSPRPASFYIAPDADLAEAS